MANSLNGTDFSVGITQQAAQGSVDASPVFTPYRRTSGKPEKTVGFTNSNEVVTGRQAQKQILDTIAYEYTLEGELTQEKKAFLRNALFSDTHSPVAITANTNLAFDSTLNEITDAGASGILFTNVKVGQWIFVTGSSNPDLNIRYYVTDKPDSDTLSVVNVPATLGAGDAITIVGTMLRSADTTSLVTLQKTVTNTSAVADDLDYITQIDALIGQLVLTLPPTGIVTTTLGVTAAEQLAGVLKISGQSYASEDTSIPISAVTDTDGIYLNYVQADADLTEMTVDFNSNLSSINQAGNLGAKCVVPKTVTCTGTLNAIEKTDNPLRFQTLYENATRFSLSTAFIWSDGREMVVTMHQCVFTDGSQPDGAEDDALFNGTYAAEKDDVFGTTLQIDTNW